MASGQQAMKKPHEQDKKPADKKANAKDQGRSKSEEKDLKKAGQVASGAAKILEKTKSKGYADQKSALKPKDKQSARSLGAVTSDPKKIGVAEAAQRAHDEHDGDSKQDHPLLEAKKLLDKAAVAASDKAAAVADPKKADRDKTPDVHGKHDDEKAEKKAEKKGLSKQKVKDDKKKKAKAQKGKHGDEAKQAAAAVAVAKDKAKGKKDSKAQEKLKGAAGKKKAQDHKEEGHGTPEEALAAETLKAVKDKKAEKKGKKKPPMHEKAIADKTKQKVQGKQKEMA